MDKRLYASVRGSSSDTLIYKMIKEPFRRALDPWKLLRLTKCLLSALRQTSVMAVPGISCGWPYSRQSPSCEGMCDAERERFRRLLSGIMPVVYAEKVSTSISSEHLHLSSKHPIANLRYTLIRCCRLISIWPKRRRLRYLHILRRS